MVRGRAAPCPMHRKEPDPREGSGRTHPCRRMRQKLPAFQEPTRHGRGARKIKATLIGLLAVPVRSLLPSFGSKRRLAQPVSLGRDSFGAGFSDAGTLRLPHALPAASEKPAPERTLVANGSHGGTTIITSDPWNGSLEFPLWRANVIPHQTRRMDLLGTARDESQQHPCGIRGHWCTRCWAGKAKP